MRSFHKTLEGMFRSFTGKVKREEEGVVSAIAGLVAQTPSNARGIDAKADSCFRKWRRSALWNKKGAGKGAAGPGDDTFTQMMESVMEETVATCRSATRTSHSSPSRRA